MINTFTQLLDKAIQLHQDGVPPESEEGQNLADAFWKMVMEFTGGDIGMLSQLIETENLIGPDNEWKQRLAAANTYIEPALSAYFTALGYNPMEGVKTK